MLSGLISCMIFGWLSNIYGRRPSIIFCYITGIISFLGLAYSPNYKIALICYAGSGIMYPFS